MSAATDKTNLAELRRTMTLWHNRVTALGFDGVSDVIALAEAGGDQMKKAWPIGERIALKLMMIKQIGEGSTTANSLPHVARIADEALECIRQRPAAQTDNMGMPTSCGKPLCAPDEHHPLCDLHKPEAQATPESVGDARQFPPLPEGWPARFRCDSCDGNGEIGELVSMGDFQPPERQTCPDCGGCGWTSEEPAFNAEHMREFAEAHARNTRPAPGVPDFASLLKIKEPDGCAENIEQADRQEARCNGWNDCRDEVLNILAAAQAKGADHV